MLTSRDRSDGGDVDSATSPAFPPSEPDEAVVVEASFAQQRLWFLDRLDPASTSYNLPLVLRLSGALDVTALERALSRLVERHETLRTTFSEHEGEVFQVVRPAQPVSLALVDLREEDKPELEAERLATAEVGRPFDLAEGPLFRACLLQLEQDEHLLVLTLHHIVGDGWSMRVLRRDLAELYSAATADRPAALPELPLQYADFAVWQHEWLQGERLDQLLAYWRERLASAPERLALPTDRPAPAVQTYRGDHRRRLLSPALAHQLKERALAEDASLFMVLLAAFSALLARYSGAEDLVVAAPVANRTRAELEELVSSGPAWSATASRSQYASAAARSSNGWRTAYAPISSISRSISAKASDASASRWCARCGSTSPGIRASRSSSDESGRRHSGPTSTRSCRSSS